jgi:hypothetical protein
MEKLTVDASGIMAAAFGVHCVRQTRVNSSRQWQLVICFVPGFELLSQSTHESLIPCNASAICTLCIAAEGR